MSKPPGVSGGLGTRAVIANNHGTKSPEGPEQTVPFSFSQVSGLLRMPAYLAARGELNVNRCDSVPVSQTHREGPLFFLHPLHHEAI